MRCRQLASIKIICAREGLAVYHPADETLLEYTTVVCPVKIGCNWTKEEIHATGMRVPHESALADEAISHFSAEAKGEVASNRSRLVLYEEIKFNIPTQIKVSPIAVILHKSRAFRSILDLSFLLNLNPRGRVP